MEKLRWSINKMIKACRQCLFSFLVFVVYCSPTLATSIADLVQQQEIIATSYVDANEPVSIGSQVTLTIDISIPIDATFSQGTIINHFEMPDAVVLAQGSFAVNSVSRINGKRYINQLWEIPIFPQATGEYVIPPIVINIGLIHKNETITGKLLTTPLAFSTFIPSPYMSDEHQWVVADQASLSENVVVTKVAPVENQDNEQKQLYVGDAIEREVSLSVQGSLAMLLPTLIDLKNYQKMGAKAYLSQGQYHDKQVRGVRTSSHTEKITLVVQEAGTVILPEIEVVWWDLESDSETRLLLASQTWQVKHTFASYVQAYWVSLLVVAILLCAVIFGLFRLLKEIKHRKETDTMPLWYQFARSIRQKNWPRSESVIYRKIKRDDHRLTMCYSSQNEDWKNSAEQLQSARYQALPSEPVKKAFLVRLWKNLR